MHTMMMDSTPQGGVFHVERQDWPLLPGLVPAQPDENAQAWSLPGRDINAPCHAFLPAASCGFLLPWCYSPLLPVIGANLPVIGAFFPDSFDGYGGGVDVWQEWAHSRLADGYKGWPPLVGSCRIARLPNGENVAARCLMVHRDGTWEGRLLGMTVNDMDPDMVARTNLVLRLRGLDWIAMPGEHGYRQGHVVRLGPGQMTWEPVEPAGGCA